MDETLNEKEILLFSNEFQKELIRLHESQASQSYWTRMIMPRYKIQEIILHLKGIDPFPPGKQRTWVEGRKFKVFNNEDMDTDEVLMEPTKERVSIAGNSGNSLPRYLQVVPREEIFNTLLKIHLDNNHSTLRETLHLVRGIISNIPRYLVHKFILLCPVCSNNGSTTNSCGLPYTPSRRCAIKARKRRKLMDQFQVDVLDLHSNADGGYTYILHCMDHITGFHWLFPLAQVDPAEVAQNLVWGIFSLFGFPSELVSDYGTDFASQIIEQVTRLWPDELQIKNYLEGGTYKGEVTRRNARNVTRFIDDMVLKKAAQGDCRVRWSEWLPEIQFMLNATVLDVRTGKTPYEKVFRSQPITNVPKTKFVGNQVVQEETVDVWTGGAVQDQQVTEEIVEHVHHGDMNTGVIMDQVYNPAKVVHDAPTVELLNDGLTFDTIETNEGTSYSIVPHRSATGPETGFVLSETVTTSEPLATHFPPSPVRSHRFDESEFNSPKGLGEKWVTLSADGEKLEMAEIRPTIQEVKISAPRNTGYRIDPILRRAEYVDGSRNKTIHSRKVFMEGSSKNSSVNNNFRGFKDPSPTKGSRVIHLSNINLNERSPRKISINNANERSNISVTGGSYSSIPVSGKRGMNSSAVLPPAKKSTPVKFPATIRTNIVAAKKPPLLKIPVSSKLLAGVSRTTLGATGPPHGTRGKYVEHDIQGEVVEDDEDEDEYYSDQDEDNDYGVISGDDVEGDDFDDSYFNTDTRIE